jgi:hypothetical protein
MCTSLARKTARGAIYLIVIAFGNPCPSLTVAFGPVIHLQPKLRPALRAEEAIDPNKQALPGF